MRIATRLLLSLIFLITPLYAAEKMTDDCMAPNYKHQILIQGSDESDGYELIIRASDGNKTLFSRPAGGYASFNASTSLANFKCLWSPDSKFVAIFERGTKRSGETSIYYINEDQVKEVTFPDIMRLIKPHLTAELRAIWIRPEVWLPDHELILSVVGTQLNEEHGVYRFILNLQLISDKTGKQIAKIKSFRQDRSIDFSIK